MNILNKNSRYKRFEIIFFYRFTSKFWGFFFIIKNTIYDHNQEIIH